MISIIIPIYNAEKYIIDCLNSIKQQNADVEVICVNDGSTDESERLIKEYISDNTFVKYMYQENSGAPTARNKGLTIAKGEFCMFFDADDILLPGALNNMISEIETANADLVIGDYNEIDERGIRITEIKQSDFVIDSSVHWYYALCPPLPGNKLIKKSVLDSSKLKFESLKIGQDLNFYLKLLTIVHKVAYLAIPVMGYRIVDGSISRQYSLKILNICKSIDNVKTFYSDKNLDSTYTKYISLVELIAYRSQLEKIKYFSTESDRREAYSVLMKKIKSCQKPDRRLFGKYIKEKIKVKLLLTGLQYGKIRRRFKI